MWISDDIAGEVHHSPERMAIETVYLKFSERDTMGRVVIVDRLRQSFETIGNKVSESNVERQVCNRKAITVKITALCINLRDGGATPVAS